MYVMHVSSKEAHEVFLVIEIWIYNKGSNFALVTARGALSVEVVCSWVFLLLFVTERLVNENFLFIKSYKQLP